MKKLIVFVVIATVVFTSCESKSGKRVKDPFKTSFQDFKEVIEKGLLDSSYVNSTEDITYYEFYLPEYKIDLQVKGAIPFKKKGEMQIYTRNIGGELVSKFCTNSNNWTEEQKREILNLLLAKKENKKDPRKKMMVL